MTTTIFDLFLSTSEHDLYFDFEVTNILEDMDLNSLNKIEHSYAGYGTYKYRLEPIIQHCKFRLLGGKL